MSVEVIYNPIYKEQEVPEVGKEYHFFDDGKISPSRHFMAKVTKIISVEESKDFLVPYMCPEVDYELILYPLYMIWEEEKEQHYWLFTDTTDCFIECSIPEYDDNLIYFAREKSGGWFSMDIQSSWQGGRLDISGKLYEELKKSYNSFKRDVDESRKSR